MESDKTQRPLTLKKSNTRRVEEKCSSLESPKSVQDVIWRRLLSLALGAKSKSLPALTKGKILYVATFQSRDCSLRGSATFK
ncbi:UNVERIFIED_CONTAM: hypothetical protein NCL1_53163 [Trichonephila clavipes]